MKHIALLGATGSIGQSTLSVIDQHPDAFSVFALSANTNWQDMLSLCQKYRPEFAAMTDQAAAKSLEQALNTQTQVLYGAQALEQIAADERVDYVMAAIVGSAGMASALAAARAGKRIMLANKESLVLAGDLFMQAVADSGAELIPVDSEHSAVFQCLQSGTAGLNKVQLTASGGPFLHTPLAQLKHTTPEQACNHPNWSMGRKISVDSATMMNKGLEVIEAHYLFDLTPDKIDVVIHPQSIVHSSVYYQDGSVLSQLGKPDMRTAIAYALSYPQRIGSGVGALDLAASSPLECYTPDLQKFACLGLAFEALKQGGSAMGTLNAANEVAVEAFLNQTIGFLDIANVVEDSLNQVENSSPSSLEAVVANDKHSREVALNILKHYG